MYGETYKSKDGVTRHRPVLENAGELHNDQGFCLGCGAEADGVEPDARRYPCEACGERQVYGLEELLMMGILRIAEKDV